MYWKTGSYPGFSGAPANVSRKPNVQVIHNEELTPQMKNSSKPLQMRGKENPDPVESMIQPAREVKLGLGSGCHAESARTHFAA
jgi:hypothetical protein